MTTGDDNNLQPYNLRGTVEASLENVSVVLADARRFTEAAGLAETPSYRLLVVIEELLTNIVTHGRPQSGTTIDYGFVRQADGVLITVADSGDPFDPRDLPPGAPAAAMANNTEGGIGWPLILQWCRLDACTRTGGRNQMALLLEVDG